MVPPEPPQQRQDPPKEWEKAEDVAMHFNDLILRLRAISVPLIAGAITAGTGLGAAVPRIDTPWQMLPALSALAGASFFIFTVFVLRHPIPNRRVKATSLEVVCFLLIAVSFAAWTGMFVYEKPDSFLFSAPVLVFGGLLLFLIYLLDRFYYTAMLVGAVDRAEQIEDKRWQYDLNLSRKISQAAEHWTYTIVPTLLYVIPVIIVLNIGLATAAYSGEEPDENTNEEEPAPSPALTPTPEPTSSMLSPTKEEQTLSPTVGVDPTPTRSMPGPSD